MNTVLAGVTVVRQDVVIPGARFDEVRAEQNSQPVSLLADHVRRAWQVNRDHRVASGIEHVMLQCVRQRNGEYDEADRAKLDGIDVFINLTGLKCRSAESWIKDVLVNAADEPWTIEPTPIPELPDDLKSQVVDMVKSEVLARGYIDALQIRERVKELKATAMHEIQRLAADASARMTEKINDQLQQGGWRAIFEQYQSDIVTYPAGVMKAPVIRNRRSLRWDGNRIVTTTEAIMVCERVSPLDLYPSPEATNPQDANNLIERMRMTKARLYECIGLPYFDEDAIRLVIDEYESGFRDWLSMDGERARAEKKQGSLWRDDETIDVLDFWGRVQGSVLQDWGIDVDDRQAQYECNAWLVGNYVIRALLNPDPLGKRPYRVTSFNKLPGQFWGEGIPQLVRDVQRTANSAARALIRNMSFASGPVVEIDVDRLDDSEDRPDKIVPWSIRYTKSSNVPGGGGPALRYNVAPSIAGDLQAIFTFYMRLADDFSGIPAYTYGNQEVGSAGRTMGGLSLLYGGALKGIKNVIMNIDRDCIEPMITSIWTHNMLYDPDPSIKADAKVIAKGAEGILQKEQAQARSIETLQVVTPFIQQGLVPPQGAQFLIRSWLQQNGFDLSDFFPNSTVDREISGVFGTAPGATPTGVPPSVQPGTPAPPLDGRQAAAQQALAQSQIPPA
ncbi:portal protein [Burkholderia cenocepacia]|uniref:portal protein n=1 Tax=Burkholderia cenocepacia TaxID=95486 RepID=UPI002B24C85C|nr:hypothetical protein [Burkholderia cenocepacia]MEB2499547.1 hypothetical protein [Burkholderia cenocepacia]MEB2557222.1 hypothetical protein [Burkholderia cenocepacia]